MSFATSFIESQFLYKGRVEERANFSPIRTQVRNNASVLLSIVFSRKIPFIRKTILANPISFKRTGGNPLFNPDILPIMDNYISDSDRQRHCQSFRLAANMIY